MFDSLVVARPLGSKRAVLIRCCRVRRGLLAGETKGFPTSSVIALTTRMVPQRDQHSHPGGQHREVDPPSAARPVRHVRGVGAGGWPVRATNSAPVATPAFVTTSGVPD